MRMLIQRVKSASVEAEGRIVGEIGKGLLVFLAIHRDDTVSIIPWMVRKVMELRLFPNPEGSNEKAKGDLNIREAGGSLLIVSQFTLYANCKLGRRPDFFEAAPAFLARALYELYVAECAELLGHVETGLFGAPMAVSLVNDGPYTFIIDSPQTEGDKQKEAEEKK